MKGTPGFQGFELLKPTDERTTWLVVTRWDSEQDYENWRSSERFGASHGEKDQDEAPKQKPVGMSAELWSYEVSVSA
ncbi:antibiotic biosynthesis monooxygenase [Nesterenkonia pannonica]|uniref:antibiotic biosynthesis monooxygenase family protein n=1 Tax=Nesterenkonia pannonica TaxID=1548602 RepID=UPI002164CCA7|nr:antibiotic biosynthesis monooxygenase family protein [Nesterenkonia pannonica]